MSVRIPLTTTHSSRAMTGLAILGRNRLDDHVSVATRTIGLRFVSYIADDDESVPPGAEDARRCETRDAAILDEDVRAVVVNVEADEREYWTRRAAEAGKSVLSDTPIVPTFSKASSIASCFESRGLTLALCDELFYSEGAARARKIVEEGTLGRLLFVEARVSVPRGWLAPRSSGVILEYGSSVTALLQEIVGRIDTVHGRMRSLGINRPEEDVAVAHLEFTNGVEAILQIVGLGERSEVQIEIHGSSGSATLVEQLPMESRSGLALAYQAFSRALAGEGSPVCDGRVLKDTMFAVDWIQQSARLGRELSRGEVRAR